MIVGLTSFVGMGTVLRVSHPVLMFFSEYYSLNENDVELYVTSFSSIRYICGPQKREAEVEGRMWEEGSVSMNRVRLRTKPFGSGKNGSCNTLLGPVAVPCKEQQELLATECRRGGNPA